MAGSEGDLISNQLAKLAARQHRRQMLSDIEIHDKE